jgi:hypothetical protein
VNICARDSVSFTGRPTSRAAMAASQTCGQARNPAPNPPPTNGERTSTLSPDTPRTLAADLPTLRVNWLAS